MDIKGQTSTMIPFNSGILFIVLVYNYSQKYTDYKCNFLKDQ